MAWREAVWPHCVIQHWRSVVDDLAVSVPLHLLEEEVGEAGGREDGT
jgi:hypothetical protein